MEPYCGNSETRKQIEQLKARIPTRDENEIVLWEKRIQCILTTGNNWSGPIRNFHLLVVTDQPEDIFATCTPGLKRSSQHVPNSLETNFHPDTELDLLILQAKR